VTSTGMVAPSVRGVGEIALSPTRDHGSPQT